MKKSRLIAPYNSKGRSNLGFCNHRSGVYLIYKDGTLVYVGYSGYNLYKTCTRHFQRWDSKYQKVVTYYNKLGSYDFKVRIIMCTPARAERLEKALIVKYKPKDNPNKLPGYELSGSEIKTLEDFKQAPALNYDDVPF